MVSQFISVENLQCMGPHDYNSISESGSDSDSDSDSVSDSDSDSQEDSTVCQRKSHWTTWQS